MRIYRTTIWLALLLSFLLVAGVAVAQRGGLQQRDRQEIEKLHQKEIQANIALDVPALASLWSDDIVSLPPEGPPLVGRDANLEYLQQSAKKLADYNIVSYTQDWQQVFQIDSDYAFEWGFISGRLEPPNGGKEVDYRYKTLRILKRDPDGSWKVHRTSWSNAPPEAASGPEGATPNP